jgi:hypothetical protein
MHSLNDRQGSCSQNSELVLLLVLCSPLLVNDRSDKILWAVKQWIKKVGYAPFSNLIVKVFIGLCIVDVICRYRLVFHIHVDWK